MTHWYAVREVAKRLGLSEGAIRARLCRHPKLFATPRYRKDGTHLRKVRVITDADAQMLTLLVLTPGPLRRRW